MYDADESSPPREHGLSVPSCPECHTPRTLVCRVCGNDEGEFEPADGNFLETVVELGLPAAATTSEPTSVDVDERATPDSATDMTTSDELTNDETISNAKPTATTTSARPVVICPSCDEAAPAEFARDCEGCEHCFDDGRRIERRQYEEFSSVNSRVMLTIWALAALFFGSIAYFWFAFGR